MRRAVIDLGTHTALLLIADTRETDYTVVRQEQRIVGLGKAIEATGRIADEDIEAAVDAFGEFRELLNRDKAQAVRVTATAVLRDAANANEVRRRLEAAVGVPVIILSGEEEARLVYLAGVNAFPGVGRALVIDIGGGSVEFVLGRGTTPERLLSLPLGAVRLTHRFIPTHPAPKAGLAALQDFLARIYGDRLKDFPATPDLSIIGVAGTFTTAAAMIQGIAEYDPARITGSVIHRDDATRWLHHVASLSLEEQRKIPGLHPKRAGYIVAGFALIASFYERFGADRLTVSDQGLRYGVLLDWMRAQPG